MSRRDDPRAHHYIVDHVNPGTTIRRRVTVQNVATIRRQIAIYPAAATINKDRWDVAPDRTANELSSWISVDHDRLKLPPEQEATVLVTIAVPKNASAGERYAVVWAETASPGEGTVRQVGRAGIRIYLSVGPGGEPASNFTISDLTGTRTDDGTAMLTAQVRNTGKRALDLDGKLTLTDGPDGLSAGPFKVEAPTLALDATTTIHVPIGQQLPDGPWTAHLELGSGWTRRTATGRVTFTPPGAAPPTQANNSKSILIGGLAASGLVLTLLLGYTTRQRLRARQPLLR
ncbi:hypothetical protein [Micromonospora sp. KC213]|uniref:hypothetical protein n=1 Tax=Micromonospora sp. KC213 TaxID=2530378 RepID=UPI0010527A86|nr:hypothetical protein [Micromonospora sp. KC213]TDC33227.1 hypothetical protein E1166_25900 [Micromonospora sp. KC213]